VAVLAAAEIMQFRIKQEDDNEWWENKNFEGTCHDLP